MIDKQVRRAPFTRLFLLVLLAGAILYLGLSFARQAGVNRQRREELHRIEQEIVAAQADLAQAEANLERAQSPQAAEGWARENGLAKPDETLVVVVSPSDAGSAGVEGSPEEGASPTSSREAWWELFFGSR